MFAALRRHQNILERRDISLHLEELTIALNSHHKMVETLASGIGVPDADVEDFVQDYLGERLPKLLDKWDPYPMETVLWNVLLIQARVLMERGRNIHIGATPEVNRTRLDIRVHREIDLRIGLNPRHTCTVDQVYEALQLSHQARRVVEVEMCAPGDTVVSLEQSIELVDESPVVLWNSLRFKAVQSPLVTAAVTLRPAPTRSVHGVSIAVTVGTSEIEILLPTSEDERPSVLEVCHALQSEPVSRLVSSRMLRDAVGERAEPCPIAPLATGPARPTGQEWRRLSRLVTADIQWFCRDWLRRRRQPPLVVLDDEESHGASTPPPPDNAKAAALREEAGAHYFDAVLKRLAEALGRLRPCYYTVVVEHHACGLEVDELVGLVPEAGWARLRKSPQRADELALAWEEWRRTHGTPPEPPLLSVEERKRRSLHIRQWLINARRELKAELYGELTMTNRQRTL
jgi:hypothetical protein